MLPPVIPAFNHSHVLPPFEGERMNSAHSSPYLVTSSELVQRFAISQQRCIVLDGLLRYRAELRGLGFAQGFQWLDGSFVEDIEAREDRAPNDIDVVTFAHRPAGKSDQQINQMLSTRPELFDLELCKREFHCDTSIVNLTTAPEWLVLQTRYWYGLYSHRRGDALWKGMLQLPLDSDDDSARALIDALMHQGEPNAGST
ncbi:hypothetical protein [Variovorax sp. EL159]|uniref:DUF6932 family protein n=1 Tax=Variovorax sp. EL159 TaxID=1566270 RepID=UPI000881B10B|nr:hypothetical protein [Variovorax sp. EL159]SCX71321.1 hypothetical protein SAMN03159363_3844 [Variovorax sp. EL159]